MKWCKLTLLFVAMMTVGVSWTATFASEPGVKSATSKGTGTSENESFSFVSRTSHMVQAFSSPLLAGMSAGIPEPPQGVSPKVGQFLAAIKGNIQGAAVILQEGSDLKLNVTLNLTDPAAATEANQALTAVLAIAKQAAPFALVNAPQELQPSLFQIVNSVSSSSSHTMVSLSLNVPGGLVQVLKNNPQLLGPVFAAQQAADNARQKNNLRQIGLAMHNYHDTCNHLPASDGNGETGPGKKTGLSWRVHILPFLEEGFLYEQFHLDEPWDSEHNKTLIPFMPDVFSVPGVAAPGETSIHVFAAPNTPFDPAKPIGFRQIIDGTSNTIMAVEAGPETATPWTQPGTNIVNEILYRRTQVLDNEYERMNDAKRRERDNAIEYVTRAFESKYAQQTSNPATMQRLVTEADGIGPVPVQHIRKMRDSLPGEVVKSIEKRLLAIAMMEDAQHHGKPAMIEPKYALEPIGAIKGTEVPISRREYVAQEVTRERAYPFLLRHAQDSMKAYQAQGKSEKQAATLVAKMHEDLHEASIKQWKKEGYVYHSGPQQGTKSKHDSKYYQNMNKEIDIILDDTKAADPGKKKTSFIQFQPTGQDISVNELPQSYEGFLPAVRASKVLAV
jgi:hypothetical protein